LWRSWRRSDLPDGLRNDFIQEKSSHARTRSLVFRKSGEIKPNIGRLAAIDSWCPWIDNDHFFIFKLELIKIKKTFLYILIKTFFKKIFVSLLY